MCFEASSYVYAYALKRINVFDDGCKGRLASHAKGLTPFLKGFQLMFSCFFLLIQLFYVVYICYEKDLSLSHVVLEACMNLQRLCLGGINPFVERWVSPQANFSNASLHMFGVESRGDSTFIFNFEFLSSLWK